VLLLEKLLVQEKEMQENDLKEQEKLLGGENAPVHHEEVLLEEELPEDLHGELPEDLLDEAPPEDLLEGELPEGGNSPPFFLFLNFK